MESFFGTAEAANFSKNILFTALLLTPVLILWSITDICFLQIESHDALSHFETKEVYLQFEKKNTEDFAKSILQNREQISRAQNTCLPFYGFLFLVGLIIVVSGFQQ